MGHAGGQRLPQSPHVSSQLGGCRLGIPVLGWGGGALAGG